MEMTNTTDLTALVHSESLLCDVLNKVSITNFDKSSALTVLVALYKHIEKQKWVASVVANILGTDLDELGHLGAFAHPDDMPQEGDVSGLKDWRYYFHGQGCCLTHIDGTEIDVDFPDGRFDVIDPYFFENYLQSLPSPSILQSRLIRPEPFENCWAVELRELKDLGWVTDEHQFSITGIGIEQVKKYVGLWDKLESNDNVIVKAHASILIGDPSLARQILEGSEYTDAENRVDILADEYEQVLYSNLMKSTKGKDSFAIRDIYKAAASLGNPYSKKIIEHALKKGNMDTMMLFIVELIDKLSPEIYSEKLEKIVSKAWRGKAPQPAIKVFAIKSLLSLYRPDNFPSKLKRKFTRALRKRLDKMGDEAGKLLYVINKKEGLKLLSICLDSDVPIVRDGAVSTLAAIGTSEAIKTLKNHGSITTETMLAIIDGVEIAKVVPLGKEIQIGDKKARTYSWEEIEAANREEELRYRYQETLKEYGHAIEIWK